jgi:nitroimidazol reductase NimA-like FMN-containing flavoprotein (pyridoxamine 5'-phosphate oxidase superfamily)
MNLLAAVAVGRVAVVVDGHPEIYPVNYALDGDSVVFRTAEGTPLNHASLTQVAFEVDEVDETTRTGWSVMVKGQADDIGGAVDATSERRRRLPLATWAPGERDRWFVIRPREVTGRRLRVLSPEL